MGAHLQTAKTKDVIQSMHKARRAVCLIGAGCSVTAGLPTAEEVVEYLRRHEGPAYKKARDLKRRRLKKDREQRILLPDAEPGYPELMECLEPRKRYRLFLRWVAVSQLNWAHLSLAYLIWRQRIGRVLTTNFDDLIVRACALYGVYPAVHDLGAMGKLGAAGSDLLYKKSLVSEPAVFHLHGRHNGFEQIHSEGRAKVQAQQLESVISESKDRLWLVVGYSGESDPLFDKLEHAAGSSRGFYWVNRTEPQGKIRNALVRAHAKYVEVPGADQFFATLARSFSTTGRAAHWLHLPQSYPGEVLSSLPAAQGLPRLTSHSQRQSKPTLRPGKQMRLRLAMIRRGKQLVLKGRSFDRAIRLLEKAGAEQDADVVSFLAQGLVLRGEDRLRRCESISQFEAAHGDFQRALEVLDVDDLVKECHACLQDRDRPLREWQQVFRLYRAKQQCTVTRDLALLGKTRAQLGIGRASKQRPDDRALDALRYEIREVRGWSRQPILQLGLAQIQAMRATCGGKVRVRLAEAAIKSFRAAVNLAAPGASARRRALAAIVRARRAIATSRAGETFHQAGTAALAAVFDGLRTRVSRLPALFP